MILGIGLRLLVRPDGSTFASLSAIGLPGSRSCDNLTPAHQPTQLDIFSSYENPWKTVAVIDS